MLSGKSKHFEIMDSFENGRLTAAIKTNDSIEIKKFCVVFPYTYSEKQAVFVNGYQSWTESREYGINDKMSDFSVFKELVVKSPFNAKSGMGRAGDLFFCRYPRKKGVFYGYSYGYVRCGKQIDLFASLSEKTGYTRIKFNVKKSQVIVEKDFDGVLFNGVKKMMDFVHLNGSYEEAFDKWFSLMNIQCRIKEKKSGYTTWYNYYRNINESIVERDLKALGDLPEKVDIFQIDDGYQKSIGDWLNTNEIKFPNGMKRIADEIHSNNMLAGLWLAPFAAAKDSFIYKEHKDWLIRDEKGRLYPAGANWGGFYAIDFYNKEAAEYIKGVFDTILNEWGYDMVKLDFLYAACVVPIHNKSRGQIMCEAMEFIRKCVGDKLVLACGVPLMPCFGLVDFCRIGADVALEWKYDYNRIREDISIPNAVNCTVFSRHLNGRAFLNDPDVFILRDENINLTFSQKKLLAEINRICGSLLFVSDNVSCYNDKQKQLFSETIKKSDISILRAEYTDKDIIYIEYEENGEKRALKFNYKNGNVN
ncbi:MAG: alpha-galactosidase [Eubacterium sp.]|nr:alpha-galactosidase [Eubacterium sp.]